MYKMLLKNKKDLSPFDQDGNRTSYCDLDDACEKLTIAERKIGVFENI